MAALMLIRVALIVNIFVPAGEFCRRRPAKEGAERRELRLRSRHCPDLKVFLNPADLLSMLLFPLFSFN
jgi:hypothetical protein